MVGTILALSYAPANASSRSSWDATGNVSASARSSGNRCPYTRNSPAASAGSSVCAYRGRQPGHHRLTNQIRHSVSTCPVLRILRISMWRTPFSEAQPAVARL